MKAPPWKTALFLAPNLAGFLLFTLGPLVATVVLSFFVWDLFSTPEFVGWANYLDLLRVRLGEGYAFATFPLVAALAAVLWCRGGFRWLAIGVGMAASGWMLSYAVPDSPKFWQSLWNTFYLLLGLPLGMFGSLFLAVLLNEKVFANRFFRLVYFLPSVVGGVGVFLLWKWIFNPDIGPVNLLLAAFGVEGPAWFDSAAWAKPALMVMAFWGSVGGTNMILYLAALQGIDPGLYEAADLDGAGRWHRFWKITVPMVSSTTVFILIMGVINGFQGGFDAAYVITRGGPAGATTTINYFIYESAFRHLEMGVASAASVLLFLLVLAMSWVNWRVTSNRVHYT